LQAKLDQIGLKVNRQKDDDAEERRHQAFVTYEKSTMAFTRANNSSFDRKCHSGAAHHRKSQLDYSSDKEKEEKVKKVSFPVTIASLVAKSAPTVATGAAALPLTKYDTRRVDGVPSKKEATCLKKAEPKPNHKATAKPKPNQKPDVEPNQVKPNQKASAKPKRTKTTDVTPPVANWCASVTVFNYDRRKMPALGDSDDSAIDYDAVADEDYVGDDDDADLCLIVETPSKMKAIDVQSPAFSASLSQELVKMGVTYVFSQALSHNSSWMTDIIGSLAASTDAKGASCNNNNKIRNYFKCVYA
jgi:hypothetical protein